MSHAFEGQGHDCAMCPLPKDHPVHNVAPVEPPSLPYDGGTSSGHSGSETSRERARDRDTSGKTGKTQQALLTLLAQCGPLGQTWREAQQALVDLDREEFGAAHHGVVTGALSNLHKDGRVARLRERRNRCEVYVLPEYVDGRETVAQGRRHKSRLTADDTYLLRNALTTASTYPPESGTRRTLTGLIALVRRLDGAPDPTEGLDL